MKSLFIFTRDLRIDDNNALYHCQGEVYPIFILNPTQLTGEYASSRAIDFMYHCLDNLAKQIPLQIYHGSIKQIISVLVPMFDEVVITKDYSPFARQREDELSKICGNKFKSYHGHLLIDYTDDPYRKFTPFYKSVTRVSKPINKVMQYKRVSSKLSTVTLKLNPVIEFNPNIEYKNIKLPVKLTDESSSLSKYLKFGVISIRRMYHNSNQEVKRQLLWRDFYTLIMGKYKGAPMKDLKWDNAKFELWKNAQTGVEIVDACMNQLNKTGFISNRARLIVADYLVNHLHCDWRLGEKHFAQQLIDYDISVNNYNWQWVVMNGYTRKLNPYRQAKLYDPRGEYISKWLK